MNVVIGILAMIIASIGIGLLLSAIGLQALAALVGIPVGMATFALILWLNDRTEARR